ncbi:adenylate/guanylate cyclase domain-containing protein [Bradyrhizobium sp. CCBAU 51753]|uniref:adenylate/guanylate cyclase domain-containing protein n=1 Tax=Bradyrhizobium sp. CCBAU 51753 TaxID=1325100 RepID=UPI001889ED37|nr:adenylate/guanylate cyclase domain-containing protein [Bradyrhizobium sp. CCBAU 51753]QOZ24697.1 adenylate/guanylate cyclase domain-containing protein [Bradyrhizobium sp. CCBAU 51753]
MEAPALPVTRYATSGDVSIAYQTMGDGPTDIILVPGFVSNIEYMHELPGYTAFLRRLATFARVVTFDKRGQGLSDRISEAPSLEQRIDDVRAVMDAIGSREATLMGFSEGCAMGVMFAAAHPDRVSRLILYGGFARFADKYDANTFEAMIAKRMPLWGDGSLLKIIVPARLHTPEVIAQFAKFERLSASPGAFRAIQLMNIQIDVRSILGSVRVPTLVLHREFDPMLSVDLGRDLAARIPNAKYIEYKDEGHAFWVGNTEPLLGDIEEFVTGHREHASNEVERVLATVLFTDIVDSTRNAAEMGDLSWRRLLDRHDETAKQIVEKYRGNLVKSTGDGILATFDGPGRAVRSALAFRSAAEQLGIQLRAGLHTGEIELRDGDIGGIAVHAAARVMAQCQPSEVLVSRVVTDLVAGAGLKFSDRGSHELKGIPGCWDLFAATA